MLGPQCFVALAVFEAVSGMIGMAVFGQVRGLFGALCRSGLGCSTFGALWMLGPTVWMPAPLLRRVPSTLITVVHKAGCGCGAWVVRP